MTSEMMNLVKNSAIASTIGLADMAAQAASCWITPLTPGNPLPRSPSPMFY
jgi:glutamate/aspartate transport system permease protein